MRCAIRLFGWLVHSSGRSVVSMNTTTSTTAAVTLQNCDTEPIHIPGAIQQPSGMLVAIDRRGRLAYASQNAFELLGPELSLGIPFEASQLGANVAARLMPWLREFDPDFELFVFEH